FTVVLRTHGEPAAAAGAALAAARRIDATVPAYDVRTMADRVADSIAQLRATMLLLLMTAALASVLAAVAIYGSISYAGSQRLPEIRLRLALGASPASIYRAVVGRAFGLTAIGVAAGVAAAMASAPLLGGLLFETRGTDPTTYFTVIAVVAVLTAAASA